MDRNPELKNLYERVCNCQNCELGATRTNFVFGVGNPNADILLIGEAPGKVEDETGIPFTGNAGKLLDKLLASINLTRDDIFIANILKCRPPQNRDPEPDEIKACTPILDAQIKAINPKVIVPVGAFATRYILGDKVKISQVKGKLFTADEGIFSDTTCRIIPVYHPAAALHNPNLRTDLEHDFACVGREIGVI